jgi:hypothetical protein
MCCIDRKIHGSLIAAHGSSQNSSGRNRSLARNAEAKISLAKATPLAFAAELIR